jgi:hypothetical protein
MKHALITFMCGLVLRVSAFAQAGILFDIDFGSNAPPHSPGVPDSGAALTSEFFYVAVYLGNIQPTAGSVVEESSNGSLITVVQFTNLIFAAYPPPPGATAFSYEQALQLTSAQTESLLAGQWYARIVFGDTLYLGRITPRGPLSLLNGSNLTEQQKRPLLATLQAANDSMARGNRVAAINQFQAFQAKVADQIGPYNADLAADLIDSAQQFIDFLAGAG